MTGARILIVDDEAANRALVRRVLELQGYTVLEASDGEEALRRVSADAPDLVLLDLQMPNVDGYGTLRALKSDPKTRLIPVVMLTAHDQLPQKVRATEMGADDYLLKPFNIAELSARVSSLVSLKRYTDELEHASKVLESIALCVEGRDRYTGNHCRRLGEYGSRVGQALGLGEEDQRILRLGGVFHDLGKVAISDMILNKPGRLTPEEFDVMKSHPLIGANLCKEMRTLSKVIPLIRNHHEKLDGSGYPDGLKGDEIPVLVRIVSVVDVYDALATKRSYKESLPREKCLSILREETAKGWWDSDVVESLARVIGERLGERKAL